MLDRATTHRACLSVTFAVFSPIVDAGGTEDVLARCFCQCSYTQILKTNAALTGALRGLRKRKGGFFVLAFDTNVG